MELAQKITYTRPVVLSIAGFDPTGGAGVLADVKTFEQLQCLGMAVNTCVTLQTEKRVLEIHWQDNIGRQIKELALTYNIAAVKIGLVKDAEQLNEALNAITGLNVPIVYDPVLKSTSGQQFVREASLQALTTCFKKLALVTPNVMEARELGNNANENAAAEVLSEHCPVLLKGGHNINSPGTDVLYIAGKRVAVYAADNSSVWPKHGSGCILSSAIAALLAKGYNLSNACLAGKKYITNALASNTGLLAYHNL